MMLSQILKQLPDTVENFSFPDEELEVSKDREEPTMPNIVSNLNRFDDDDDEERVFDVKTEVSIFLRGGGIFVFDLGFCFIALG